MVAKVTLIARYPPYNEIGVPYNSEGAPNSEVALIKAKVTPEALPPLLKGAMVPPLKLRLQPLSLKVPPLDLWLLHGSSFIPIMPPLYR